MLFRIKELKIQEDLQGEDGIQAISVVDDPAINVNFEYFAKGQLLPFFKYTAYPDPEIIPTSHKFCRSHAGQVFHIDEIKTWTSSDEGWIADAQFFQNFTNDKGGPNYEGDYSFNCDSQLFNCRHRLIRVSKTSDIPPAKKAKYGFMQDEHFVEMKMASEEKHEIEGLVLRSNQMIYRNDVDGSGNPGYVYFSRETVRKLKEKYGWNRNMTFQHRENILGKAILMDSYLEEDEKLKETRWFLKYKIIDNKLWELVKNKVVKGFSLEGIFKM